MSADAMEFDRRIAELHIITGRSVEELEREVLRRARTTQLSVFGAIAEAKWRALAAKSMTWD